MARASGWTAARRAKHAQAIRKWKPWEHATGPITPEGKARASRNATGTGCRQALDKELAAIEALIDSMAEERDAMLEDAR